MHTFSLSQCQKAAKWWWQFLPDPPQFSFYVYVPHQHLNLTTGTFVLFNDHTVGVQGEVGLIVEVQKHEGPEGATNLVIHHFV